jgi:hypothetical protein
MNSLDLLRQTIRFMSTEEIKVAHDFIRAFNTRGLDSKNISLRLYEILLDELKNKTNSSEHELEELLYGTRSGAAFPRLVLRLRDKVLESLTLSINIDRKDAYSERGCALHTIRKNLSVAQIIQVRGQDELAGSLLDDCIKQALYFEHFEECAAAMQVRLQHLTQQNNVKRADQMSAEYDRVVRAVASIKRAVRYYSELVSHLEYKGCVSNEILVMQINELKKELDYTRSANIAYFLTYLEIQYYQNCSQYLKAAEVLKNQVDLVEAHPALHSPSRLILSKLNQAWNDLYAHRFKSALRITAKLISGNSTKSLNMAQVYLTEFYALFYTRNYEAAITKLEQINTWDEQAGAEYRIGKRNYLMASSFFLIGKHIVAKQILSQKNIIEHDKEGWNLALRVLFIMNEIELEEIESAFRSIESLRKQIDKFKKTSTQFSRIELIYELLRGLSNSRFDFKEARQRKLSEFQALQHREENSWKILSPEMVIFDQWFISHILKIPFKQELPSYVEVE